MRSQFYPSFFDNDIVAEEIERVLAQPREADDLLYTILTRGNLAFTTTPENAKACALLEVLKAYPMGRGRWNDGAAGAIQRAYYTIDRELKEKELEQVLRDWKCIR